MGLSDWQVFRDVFWPGAWRRALPQYGNEVVQMMHATALASTVTIVEILRVARDVYTNYLVVPESFGMAAVFYLGLTVMLTQGFRLLERHYLRHLDPRPASRPQPAEGRARPCVKSTITFPGRGPGSTHSADRPDLRRSRRAAACACAGRAARRRGAGNDGGADAGRPSGSGRGRGAPAGLRHRPALCQSDGAGAVRAWRSGTGGSISTTGATSTATIPILTPSRGRAACRPAGRRCEQPTCALIRAGPARSAAGADPRRPSDTLRHHLLRLALAADVVLDLHCDGEAEVHLYTQAAALDRLHAAGGADRLPRRAAGRRVGRQSVRRGAVAALGRTCRAGSPACRCPMACATCTVELRGRSDVSRDSGARDAGALMDYLDASGRRCRDP